MHACGFNLLLVKISQSAGEFISVNAFVHRIMFVGAVWSCAACGPPEKALFGWTATEKLFS